MLTKSEFWLLTLLAALAAVFAVVNMVLYHGNRGSQLEVSSRQQYIQQSIQLQGLYTEIVRALADLSVRNQDPELANLLSSHGVSLPAAGSGRAKPEAPQTGAK